ncbi:hypothetical protein HK096_005691, partial [Nowakowskiella sp. JEL0078]
SNQENLNNGVVILNSTKTFFETDINAKTFNATAKIEYVNILPTLERLPMETIQSFSLCVVDASVNFKGCIRFGFLKSNSPLELGAVIIPSD